MNSQKTVLDIGVGTDRSYRFNPHVPVNYTPLFMDKEEPAEELRKWDWIVGDAQYIPLRDGSVDGVIVSHVIEHLDNPYRLIHECWRILKKNGFLELRLPNFLSVNAWKDPNHKHAFNALSLGLILKRAGFTVHFEHSAGSLLPKPLRTILIIFMNLLAEEIRIWCTKK